MPHVVSVLIYLCLSLAACTHQPYYQAPSSDMGYATLNVDLVGGGFLESDKPIVALQTMNGLPFADWGGGILSSIRKASYDIPAGSVFIEVVTPQSKGSYVYFDSQKGEIYTLFYHEIPHQRFALVVKDSAGRAIYSHEFLQDYRLCTYGDADTRLIDAIAFQDVGKVKKLLDDGVEPNRLKCAAWHPLPLAAKDNNVQILRLLLAAGAQVGGFDGVKAMRYALKNDNLDMMKLLVANGADINLRKDYFVNSLLMDPAGQGNVRFVKFLLEHGAYTEFRDRDGKTASLLAKESGHKEIVDLINNHTD